MAARHQSGEQSGSLLVITTGPAADDSITESSLAQGANEVRIELTGDDFSPLSLQHAIVDGHKLAEENSP